MRLLTLLLLVSSLSGCAFNIPFFHKQENRVGGVYKENLDPERVVDLIITEKLTGKKQYLVLDESLQYLEGYLRGIVVDYNDTPLEGIVVRVLDRGKDMPGFDPAVSDSNGVYRIRFSLPIKKNMVDVKATIAYNPPWQQQLDILGAALEPQTKLTNFRLYYDKKQGIIGIGEDMPKTITKKVTEADMQIFREQQKMKKTGEKKSSSAPPPVAPPQGSPKKPDDAFGGFGDFGN